MIDDEISRFFLFLFERELALLVALQVLSSKEGGGGRENFLTRFCKLKLEA